MTIVKATLIDKLTQELGLTNLEAKTFVNHFFNTIKKPLLKGEDVLLSGFGNFTLREKKSRPARNPRTGEYALVSARKVITFKTGNKLKKEVQLKGELES